MTWQADDALTGDFDVVVEFSGFTSGGTGAFFQAVAGEVGEPAWFASGGIGNVSEALLTDPALSAAVVPGVVYSEAEHADIAGRDGTETGGTVRFVRSGTTLTVTTTVGANVATHAADGFDGAAYSLALQLGNNNPLATVDAETSVSVDGVTGSLEDLFDCDSLSGAR